MNSFDLFGFCIESIFLAAIGFFTLSYCRYVWVRVSLNAIAREVAELKQTVVQLQSSVVSCPAVLRTAEPNRKPPQIADVIVPFKRPQRAEVVKPIERTSVIAQMNTLRAMKPAHLRRLCREHGIVCSTRGRISENTIAKLAEAMKDVA